MNLDSQVNILDVMTLINYVLEGEGVEPEIFWSVDMNYSDDLNILDITKLVYFVLFH